MNKRNNLYVNYPGKGLGVISKISRKTAKIGIVNTGECITVPAKDALACCIQQFVTIKQIGSVKLHDYIKVNTSSESYVLQLLKISESEDDGGCTFAKFWRDECTGKYRNGILRLDSNEFFNVDASVMKLRKLTHIPKWMCGHPMSPVLQFKSKIHSR